jgi:pimeloyl-ACP methyl ester carboxylesterase
MSEIVRLELGPDEWLEGDWRPAPPSPDFAVVYVHGFGSVRNGVKAQALRVACDSRHWNFAAFDFRGHGKSSGLIRDVRPSRLLADLDAVRAFLADRGVRRLCLVGSSMGGWASAWFAMQHPDAVVACVLAAPAFHFPSARWDRMTPAEREQWRRDGVARVRNEWLDVELGYGIVDEIPLFPRPRLLDEFRTPALIFHGMKDEVVPFAQSLAFMEHAKHPHLELHFFKDGDHRLADRRQQMAEAACRFFERILCGDAANDTVG